MSKARHHAGGGKVEPGIKDESDVYAGEHSHVLKEAEEKKDGGAVAKKKKRHEKLKSGGHVEGHMAKQRHDRPGRKRGGRAGADKMPLTEASKITNAGEHHATEGNAEEGP